MGAYFQLKINFFIKMAFCIPYALPPLKISATDFESLFILVNYTNHQGQLVILEHLPNKLFPLGLL